MDFTYFVISEIKTAYLRLYLKYPTLFYGKSALYLLRFRCFSTLIYQILIIENKVYLHNRTLNALNYNIISEFVIFQNDKQRLLLAIQPKRGVFPLFYEIKQCTLRICADVLSAWFIFMTLKFLSSVIFLVQIFAAYNDDMQSSSRFHRKSYVIKMGWFQYYLNKLCNKVWIKLQIDNYILSFELYLCQTKIYLWFEFLYSISNMFQKSFLN